MVDWQWHRWNRIVMRFKRLRWPKGLHVCVMLGLLVGLGCGEDDEERRERVTEAYLQLDAARLQLAEQRCSCYATTLLQFPDEDQCLRTEYPGPTRLEPCLLAVAECRTFSYESFIMCLTDAVAAYDACLDACPQDPSTLIGCVDQYEAAIITCENDRDPTLAIELQQCQQGIAPVCPE